MKMISILFFLFLTLFMTACSDKPIQKPIVLSTGVWIGYAPIYYAQEMGWLKEMNIQVLPSESTGDSLAQFESGASDMFAVTQFEFLQIKKKYPDITACIIHDRSFGGDVIVANRTLEELHKSDETIELYLELNSVNEEMWKYFMEIEHFDRNRFRIAPRSQEEMSRLKSSPLDAPMMAITFNPYDLPMMQNGFQQIVSTKDRRYLIVDGIHARRGFIKEHREDIIKLKEVLNRAIKVSQEDPQKFYMIVKPYLHNPTYEEFQAMMENIEWIYPYPSEETLVQLRHIGYSTEDLIK